jgi:hypothetical protein
LSKLTFFASVGTGSEFLVASLAQILYTMLLRGRGASGDAARIRQRIDAGRTSPAATDG